MLHSLRHEWAPRCMVVSFKLETDESILVKKVIHVMLLAADVCVATGAGAVQHELVRCLR
jgi:hypothetical protein